MKKIAFASQVFALTMMLPLCVIIEMNRATVESKEISVVSELSGKVKGGLSVHQYAKGSKTKILNPFLLINTP